MSDHVGLLRCPGLAPMSLLPKLPSCRRPRCCRRAALASLLDGVDEPLLLFDDLGRLSFCNRAAMRTLGAEPGLTTAQLAAVLARPAGADWLAHCMRNPVGRTAFAARDAGRRARGDAVGLAHRA